MNIGMILDGPFPPDPRVQNEAFTLLDHGHRVFLFCLEFEGRFPQSEDLSGIEVRRVHLNPMWRSLSALAYTVPWYHSVLRPELRSFLSDNEIHIAHVHDIQAASVAFEVSRELGVPMILDLHENRPEIMKDYTHVKSFPGRFLIHPSRWKQAESRAIKSALRTIVVTEEAKQVYTEQLSIEPQNIIVVPNTVRSEFYTAYETDEAITRKYSKHFTLLYLGDTGVRRGLLTVLEAIRRLIPHIPTLKISIVGKSRSDRILREYVARNGLQDYVEFEGWQDMRKFQSFILASDIGLCPIHRNLHHDTTYANKIFQCLSLGRPMLVSDCPAQANLVRTHKCGLIFRDQDPLDFADQVINLYENSELRKELGRNGLQAVRSELHWQKTSKELVSLYAKLDRNFHDRPAQAFRGSGPSDTIVTT